MRIAARLLPLALLLTGLAGCDADEPMDFPGLVTLCKDAAGTDCPCGGALIAPDVIISAQHCGALPYAIFNRSDGFSVGAPEDVVQITGRCRQQLSDPDCLAVVSGVIPGLPETDIDLYFLEHPVTNTPARLSSEEDRVPSSGATPTYVVIGNRTGQHRIVPLAPPGSCTVGGNTYGQTIEHSVCSPHIEGPDELDDNDSGAPVFVVNADGEAVLTGVHNAGQGAPPNAVDIWTDLHPFRSVLPASSRPPFFIDPDFLFPWRRQCEWPLIQPLTVFTMMAEASDFDGDGNDDGFFADENGQPFFLPAGAQEPLEFEYAGENIPYPMSYVGVDVLGAEGSELVGIDPDGDVRVARLEGQQWVADEFAPLSLLQFDGFWGGTDLRYAFDEGHFSVDPLLRSGDLDGDGQSDLLASLEETLVILRHDGQQWEPTAVSFETLGVPNESMYRESIALADVTQGWPGDELLVRRPCGLAVFGFDGQSLELLADQACGEEPWVLSDENGFDTDNLWRYGVGNLNGDACDDLVVRTDGAVYQLFADCEGQVPQFEQGPETGLVFRGRIGSYEGWSHGLEGALRLADIDGDGLDDMIANSPSGPQVHINRNAVQAPFAMVGGLDPEQSRAARPHLEVDDWSLLTIGRFDGVHREFISLRSAVACLELWWLFD